MTQQADMNSRCINIGGGGSNVDGSGKWSEQITHFLLLLLFSFCGSLIALSSKDEFGSFFARAAGMAVKARRWVPRTARMARSNELCSPTVSNGVDYNYVPMSYRIRTYQVVCYSKTGKR